MVIVEIAGKHLRMVADFDMTLFLIFQSLAVSGVGQEQAHFLTLPANRRVMVILLYKRLEQGAYQWPRSESEVKTLTPQQYRWLMEGLQIEQPKAHRPVTGLSTV